MDWVHLHLALNHVPVLGIPFLLVLLLWSWLGRQTATLRFSLWLLVVLTMASIAIKFTGDFAAEKIAADQSVGKALIERHEESADQATTGAFFMGISAALTLFVSRGDRRMPMWSLLFVIFLAVATVGLMVRAANLGGHIRHPEIPANPGQTP